MDANPYPLRQILALERRYVIPTFQRDYEWTKEGQWELLFDDLDAIAQRLGGARRLAAHEGRSAAEADREVSPHFLGAVVLDQLPSPAGGIGMRAVIDGQQRITTLQLLIRGLLDVLLERESRRQGMVRRLLRNPDDIVVASPDEAHKLWPRKRDREAWRKVMQDEQPEIEHPYAAARAYFADRVRDAVSAGDAAPSVTLDLLVDACLDLFRIVVIDLDPNDDAQVIFEVLNGRQTPLSSADLVKNLLFLRAESSSPSEVDELYDRYWSRFDDGWWKREVGRGHAARRHTDLMLAAWLTAIDEEPGHPDRLYGHVRRLVDRRHIAIPDLLEGIGSYAEHYRSFRGVSPVEDSRIRTAYERLRALGEVTVLPLVLWLRDQQLSAATERRALVGLESYMVRRAATGASTRAYQQVFRDVLSGAKEALDAGEPADLAVEKSLLALEANVWRLDEEVREAFVNRRYYGNVAAYVIRLLFAGIEERLKTENRLTEQTAVSYDALTIEHIMPRSWREHWPVSAPSEPEQVLAEQWRDAHLHRLGNLTLLNRALNTRQSNAPWSEKRLALAEHSALRLNADLATNAAWDTWDEQKIIERGEHLAAVACRAWPRPTD